MVFWWDTISIPNEAKARSLALANMHDNYAKARWTIVHDLFLLNQEWTDGESACLALILSPWFTRGWTSLELVMSHKVKVLFKGSDPTTADMRDLDEHILANDPGTSSRTHWLASSLIRRIRQLRDSKSDLSDILAILRPRVTSWIRDRPIIASLLAEVPDPDFSLSEGEITQRLVAHIGTIRNSFLLHGHPTMTDAGRFSWCPADLDDVPINIQDGALFNKNHVYAPGYNFDHKDRPSSDDSKVSVHLDGSIRIRWFARPVNLTDIKTHRIRPYGSNLSVVLKTETALLDWKNCLILYKDLEVAKAALLVMTIGIVMESEGDAPRAIDCRYVGAVHDHRREFRDLLDSNSSSAKANREVDYQDHGDFTDRLGTPTYCCWFRLGKDAGKRAINASDAVNEYLAYWQ